MNIKTNVNTKSDAGFTLLEVLIVVVLIGIIAAIATPLVINQKSKAIETAVETTLAHMSVEMEKARLANYGTYPSTVPMPKIYNTSVPIGNLVTDGTFYCLEASHVSGDKVWHINSTNTRVILEGTC